MHDCKARADKGGYVHDCKTRADRWGYVHDCKTRADRGCIGGVIWSPATPMRL